MGEEDDLTSYYYCSVFGRSWKRKDAKWVAPCNGTIIYMQDYKVFISICILFGTIKSAARV